MKKELSFLVILFVYSLSVMSQEQNANLNMSYHSTQTYQFDENSADWVKIDAPKLTFKFDVMDSTITVNDTVFNIISIKKKNNKKDKSKQYFFVLQNQKEELIDAEFHQYWFDDKRYHPQFIFKNRAYDLK